MDRTPHRNGERRTEKLSFLPAANVDSPVGSLAELELCGREDEKVGTFDGVLIDPMARRVRYYVVKPAGLLPRRRFLLPVESGIRVERDARVARLEMPPDAQRVVPFDPRRAKAFCEEDVLEAVFGSNAA